MLYQSNNPHGGDRYAHPVELDFSVNTNPLGPPEGVVRAVEESAGLLDRYPDPHCRALVRALADFEGVPEAVILCGCGAAEVIFSFCGTLRPRRALETAPTFSEYRSALEAAGCVVERYPLAEENGFALTDRFPEFLLKNDYDAVFLCNPNNPTGRVIHPALLEDIRLVCQKKGVWLFVDECFLDLAEGGQSLRSRLGPGEKLFLLRAFTKTFSMAALRLGYGLCGDSGLLAEMARRSQPWNVSLPAQLAGTAALEDLDYLVRSRALIRAERRYLAAALEALGLQVCPSDANYLLFRGPADLKEQLLVRVILIRDCSNYRGLGPGWYRAAVKLPEENRRLAEALRHIL
ncbi:MAG: aminotransferase class I/II-fold pyridoxal phosphate-dependent enzyme [Oscillospiraceae bacterium]|nr:aminotransferase class I/II-fold pyridoxal phosphate-dependent enzyme [Oscillospiraceae bacterium]